MRKVLFAALTLATTTLPGCIFAIGADRHHWNDGLMSDDCCEEEAGDCCGECVRMDHMQAQLDAIEHHVQGECTADCPYCKAPMGKDDAKPAASSDAKPAPAPAAVKPATKP